MQHTGSAPDNMAVLQVSVLIWSLAPLAAAQVPTSLLDVAPRLADLLSKNECGDFADLAITTIHVLILV